MTNIKLSVDDMQWTFNDEAAWRAFQNQLSGILANGNRGVLNLPRGGAGSFNVVVNPSTKINWIDFEN